MKTRIKFFAHLLFPAPYELPLSDMIRSIDIICATITSVAKIFNGTPTYSGNGSETIQYDDVVEFEDLSEVHKEAILQIYPFARVIPH